MQFLRSNFKTLFCCTLFIESAMQQVYDQQISLTYYTR